MPVMESGGVDLGGTGRCPTSEEFGRDAADAMLRRGLFRGR